MQPLQRAKTRLMQRNYDFGIDRNEPDQDKSVVSPLVTAGRFRLSAQRSMEGCPSG